MEYYKFDAGKEFGGPVYFPKTEEGILAMNHFWYENWTIGYRPKITLEDRNEQG